MVGTSSAILEVSGMTCGACVATIEKQAQSMEGVQEVVVSLATNECRVKFDSEVVSAEDVVTVIEDCGFDARVVKVHESQASCKSARFQIQGMTCASCVMSITKNVQKVDGVRNVAVSLVTEECCVEFEKSRVTSAEICQVIEDCGFDARLLEEHEQQGVEDGFDDKSLLPNRKQTTLKVVGLHDDAGKASIEASLSTEPGVSKVDVDLDSALVTLHYDSSITGVRSLASKIDNLGFHSSPSSSFDNIAQIKALDKIREIRFWQNSCIQACCGMTLMLLLYKLIPKWAPQVMRNFFVYHQTPLPGLFYRDIIGLLISCYIQFWVGRHFYISGWKAIRHGSGSMDTFVLISTMCAFSFSLYSLSTNIWKRSERLPNVVFDASTMLIGFISVGKLLENKAKSQTNSSLSKLLSLAPSNCTIIENDTPQEIPVEYLQVGDIIEIKPGAKIPTDGIIIEGESEIDESLITGESLMVPRYVGYTVIGGSINGPGRFLFKATKVGDDTKLSHIIQTMKQAQLSKAPIQHYADYLASKFVPFILTLALITFVSWYILCHTLENPPVIFDDPNGKFFICLQMTISVIVVACPCALGLAAPTAIMVGTGLGARHGVLIKGGEVLEKCSSLETFLFDKTGTLTTGHMVVDQYVPMGGCISLTLEQAACIKTISATSEHPVAKAIFDYTSRFLDDSTMTAKVLNSKSVIGGGVIGDCEINGVQTTIILGNKSILQNCSLLPDPQGTVSFVEIDGELVGRFEVSDRIKNDSRQVVNYLISKGHRVCMVTGDNHGSAMKVALELGIDANNVYSELTPFEKNQMVEQLQDGGQTQVAFVGDGINDSPALVTSDLGISVSTGTDIAMEAADVILLSSSEPDLASLQQLVYALDIASATLRQIRVNFFWAVCYNVFMLPIAMGVLVPWSITLDPIVAVACMAASSVSVVGSSLLLNKWKPPSLENANRLRFRTTDSSRFLPPWLARIFRRNQTAELDDIELQTGLMS
ncbi:LADA_0A02234g1_1 [Lachancea dasiensis]|uniref:LADA_0A02234g1_1 n=1 Tax=Lachancea dasiensis TaxID=1072105 RepID=A0A1G4IMB6_9SACH|nr:LADA_0A02234g1_1 [Lachancea dasiensis]